MNGRFKNMSDYMSIKRVEFMTTKRCNANCKHCSVPINSDPQENGYANIDVIKKCYTFLANNNSITSTMVYGGEPLLSIDHIVELFGIAAEYNIPTIDLITSGFLTYKESKESVHTVVDKLNKSGVKRILLSVDAFHQERIPIEYVEWFLSRVVQLDFCEILLHPAWLISKENNNSFNSRTQKILDELSSKYHVGISGGNFIIPSGSNKQHIGQFYAPNEIHMDKKCGEIPYTNPLDRITSLRILPNGNLNICRGMTIGNVFEQRIEDILKSYSPDHSYISSMLYYKGVQGIYELSKEYGATINPTEYYGTCDFCSDCISFLKARGVK